MAKKDCSICGKEVGFLGRLDLRDGYICDECYKEVCKKYSLESFDASDTTPTEVKQGIFANPKRLVKEQITLEKSIADNDAQQTFPTDAVAELPKMQNEHMNSQNKGDGCYKFIGFLAVVAVFGIVALVFWFFYGGLFDKLFFAAADEVVDQIEEQAEDRGQEFIKMVKETEIGETGKTYKEFADGFDKSNWRFFIAEEGQRVVEFTGTDDDTKVKMQIVISDYDENNYWIEPKYMEIDGVPVKDISLGILLFL